MTRTFAILGRSGGREAAGSRACRFTTIGTEVGPSRRIRRIGEEAIMLKFLGTTMGIIFLIGLLVVIGLFALIF